MAFREREPGGFPLTHHDLAWEDRPALDCLPPHERGRSIPVQSTMTLPTFRHASWWRLAAMLAAAAVVVALHSARAEEGAASSERSAPAGPATGQIGIRLVRLLSEVPADVAKKSGPLHDLRVELVPGNVIVFRKGSEFAALLPIDKIQGRADSLRYFYYVERSPMFWFFGGARLKGIRAVADGGAFQFDTFRLVWGNGGEQAGWIYFPDTAENQGLRFYVVGGQSVDQADTKETKYWVELGSEGKAGF